MINQADTERWRRLHPPERTDNRRDSQVLDAYIAEFGPPPDDMTVAGVDYDRRVVLLRVSRRLPNGVAVERFTFAECNSEGWTVAKTLWQESEARRRASLSRVLMASWPKPPASTVY